jgi:hypothetical protein
MSRTTVIKFRERKTTEAKKSLNCCEQKRRGSGPEIILEKARGLDLPQKHSEFLNPSGAIIGNVGSSGYRVGTLVHRGAIPKTEGLSGPSPFR